MKSRAKITLTVLAVAGYLATEIKTVLSRSKRHRDAEAEKITTLLGVVAPMNRQKDVSKADDNDYNENDKFYE